MKSGLRTCAWCLTRTVRFGSLLKSGHRTCDLAPHSRQEQLVTCVLSPVSRVTLVESLDSMEPRSAWHFVTTDYAGASMRPSV